MKNVGNKSLFPIYTNEETGHALVISGIGSVKSAAAATFLKNQLKIKDHSAWINFLLTTIREIYKRRLDDVADAIQTEMGAPTHLAKGAQAMVGLGHLKHL